MTAQVLFSMFFSEKDPHLNAVEWLYYKEFIRSWIFWNNYKLMSIDLIKQIELADSDTI